MLQENTFRKQQKRKLDAEKLLTMKVKGFLSLFLIILMVSAVHSEEDLGSVHRSSFLAGLYLGLHHLLTSMKVQQMKMAEDQDDFRDHAELCFGNFGDRVKHWITLNEPLTVVVDGYATGIKAPGRCSEWLPVNCTGGDSSTEPYIAAHNQLLAHAAAVKVYRDKYQISYRDFNVTRNLLMIFEGLNYYTAKYAADVPCQSENLSYPTDFCAVCAADIDTDRVGLRITQE
ncbi:hypothetical protein GH714_003856 [Hevea brasiliensis]|uniref:Uncharacterized protein n=1 Tax=Hevea brasiliensis TaxID=3981 RepID=A0A6A6KXA6_HEVBR|nr:hypothetical protein GH714_003856 [Hevea brasiliensis]